MAAAATAGRWGLIDAYVFSLRVLSLLCGMLYIIPQFIVQAKPPRGLPLTVMNTCIIPKPRKISVFFCNTKEMRADQNEQLLAKYWNSGKLQDTSSS